MKAVNWNTLSELGLLARINKEILHPLGLAVYRTPEDGSSGGALISPDGEWQYAPDMDLGIKSDEEVRELLKDIEADLDANHN